MLCAPGSAPAQTRLSVTRLLQQRQQELKVRTSVTWLYKNQIARQPRQELFRIVRSRCYPEPPLDSGLSTLWRRRRKRNWNTELNATWRRDWTLNLYTNDACFSSSLISEWGRGHPLQYLHEKCYSTQLLGWQRCRCSGRSRLHLGPMVDCVEDICDHHYNFA